MTLSREKVYEKKKGQRKKSLVVLYSRETETEKANMDMKEELPNM